MFFYLRFIRILFIYLQFTQCNLFLAVFLSVHLKLGFCETMTMRLCIFLKMFVFFRIISIFFAKFSLFFRFIFFAKFLHYFFAKFAHFLFCENFVFLRNRLKRNFALKAKIFVFFASVRNAKTKRNG